GHSPLPQASRTAPPSVFRAAPGPTGSDDLPAAAQDPSSSCSVTTVAPRLWIRGACRSLPARGLPRPIQSGSGQLPLPWRGPARASQDRLQPARITPSHEAVMIRPVSYRAACTLLVCCSLAACAGSTPAADSQPSLEAVRSATERFRDVNV